jgi:putative addiction module component (TIGR02574 family)
MAELLAEINNLTIADRLRLVQEILKTVEFETSDTSVFELTKKQQIELDHRWESVLNGSANLVSWDSVEEKLAKRYEISN